MFQARSSAAASKAKPVLCTVVYMILNMVKVRCLEVHDITHLAHGYVPGHVPRSSQEGHPSAV
jgi:hypothetical protein